MCEESRTTTSDSKVAEWVTKTDWPLLEKQKLELLSIAGKFTPEDGQTLTGRTYITRERRPGEFQSLERPTYQ
jgi:hypothetical protein